MKLANVEIPDRLAAQAARRWPRATWSALITRAVAELLSSAGPADYAATLDDFGHGAHGQHAQRVDAEAEAVMADPSLPGTAAR